MKTYFFAIALAALRQLATAEEFNTAGPPDVLSSDSFETAGGPVGVQPVDHTPNAFNTAAIEVDAVVEQGAYGPQVRLHDSKVAGTLYLLGRSGLQPGDAVAVHVHKTGHHAGPVCTCPPGCPCKDGGQCTHPDTCPAHRRAARTPTAPRQAPPAQYVHYRDGTRDRWTGTAYVRERYHRKCNGPRGCTSWWAPVAVLQPQPAPMPAQQRAKSQAPRDGMHSHLCRSCGYEFWHGPGGSHNCPSCGRGGNYAKHRVASGGQVSSAASSGRQWAILPRNR